MLRVCRIDTCNHMSTMWVAGREDRALLRSNPSARTGAGTGAGAYLRGRLSPPNLFWPQSEKPWGSGGKAPSSDPGAVCQLSTLLECGPSGQTATLG